MKTAMIGGHMKRILLLLVAVMLCGCGKSAERKAQVEASISFANEWGEWSQQLTSDGEKLGAMLGEVLNGGAMDREQFEGKLAEFEQKVDDKMEAYRSQEFPDVPELTAYRDLVLEYLEFEKTVPVVAIRRIMDVAADPNMSDIMKQQEIVKALGPVEQAETEWKDRLDTSVKELEAWVNLNAR